MKTEETETTILSFATQKGGSGKTTLTHLMALALSGKTINKKVLVIDTDEQRNLTKSYQRIMKGEGSISYDSFFSELKDLRDNVKSSYGKYDFILFDLPGTFMADGVRSAFLMTDYVFIPVQASQLDIDSMKDVNKLVGEIKDIKEKKDSFFEYYFFVAKAEPNRISTKNLINLFEQSKLPVLDSTFPNYEKFKYSVGEGKNLIDNPIDKADFAFTTFFENIYKIIKK